MSDETREEIVEETPLLETAEVQEERAAQPEPVAQPKVVKVFFEATGRQSSGTAVVLENITSVQYTPPQYIIKTADNRTHIFPHIYRRIEMIF